MERAIRTKEPVVGGHYLGGRLSGALRAALEDVRHTLTVPLVLDGEAVAVMVLSRRRDVAFGPDELATVRLLANHAVVALRNAWLYAEAQDASRLKSDFLNMAAHELRTPFTVVAGYLSLLSEGSLGPPPPEWKQPLAILDAKAAELGRLVEDLLLASRLDSGGLPIHLERLHTNELAEAALTRSGARAELLAADIAFDPEPEDDGALADADHVARILDNLVNNALTYSRGTPWVRVRVRRGHDGVRVEVEDRGRGIGNRHALRVFDRFYRVDDEGAPLAPGSGLGLYISRELAERLGGRLELEWSRPGEGSRFVLVLPVAD
jgi:signal transduction histidine kinase